MEKDVKKWNEIAPKYARMARGNLFHQEFLYPLILKSLSKIKNQKILDAGCGPGFFSKILAKKEAKVFAIDASKEFIKISKGNTKFKIKYKIADLNKRLDFKDNFFDYIVAIHILMDIKNLDKAISEFARTLKPKGELIFSISHPCFTLPALHWKRGVLGRVSLKWSYTQLGNYFHRKRIEKYLLKKSSIFHYHRPQEDYIKTLISAGFSILDFQEPKMSKDLAKKTNFFLADKIPMVLIIKAKKV